MHFYVWKQFIQNDFQGESYKMYDTIPQYFQSVADVILFYFKWSTENSGVSHHRFYSSHAGNRSVETVFTQTYVYDDTLGK